MSSLRGDQRHEFPQKVRKAAFARCCQPDGIPKCETCKAPLRSGGIIYEHDQADGLGGQPTDENCKVHCTGCARAKDKIDNAIMQKADAVLKKAFGLQPARKKIQSAGFRKAPPQRTASRPIERKPRDARC